MKQKVVDILNEILVNSPETIYFYLQQVRSSVPIIENQQWIVDHPSLIPVVNGSGYSLGLIGILNGILYDSLDNMERLAYYEDVETGEIQKFAIITLEG